jgi:hypothetical protein
MIIRNAGGKKHDSKKNYSPSWLPQSQSKPLMTLAPTKIPFAMTLTEFFEDLLETGIPLELM